MMNEQTENAGSSPVERRVRPSRGDKAATFKRDVASCWKCLNCDTVHTLGVYVFAHWNDDLEHTCDCGHRHSVLRGEVTYCGA